MLLASPVDLYLDVRGTSELLGDAVSYAMTEGVHPTFVKLLGRSAFRHTPDPVSLEIIRTTQMMNMCVSLFTIRCEM